jgi:hypothetical protein
MKTNYLKLAVMAIVAGAVLSACGSSNVAKTPEQKAAANRGVKLDKEECEELAIQESKRASGIGNNQTERLAKNTAALDARFNLLSAIQTIVVGMIKNFDQEHQAGANQNLVSDFVNQSGEEQKGLIEGVLSSSIICSNTYAQPDGSYRVYVCVEMNDETIGNLYKKLSQDKKISIQYEEARFRKEMEEGLDKYRNLQQQ